MEEKQKNMTQDVYSEVTKSIEDQDVRELWYRLRSELTRDGGGPDACRAYLDSELTRMEEQTRRALQWLGEGQGG